MKATNDQIIAAVHALRELGQTATVTNVQKMLEDWFQVTEPFSTHEFPDEVPNEVLAALWPEKLQRIDQLLGEAVS